MWEIESLPKYVARINWIDTVIIAHRYFLCIPLLNSLSTHMCVYACLSHFSAPSTTTLSSFVLPVQKQFFFRRKHLELHNKSHLSCLRYPAKFIRNIFASNDKWLTYQNNYLLFHQNNSSKTKHNTLRDI